MPDPVIFIVRLFCFAVIHSLMATDAFKTYVCKLHQTACKCYRLFYNLLSLILFGWAMGSYRHSPVIYFVPGIWSLVMYLFQFLLLLLLLRCVQQTGAAEFIGTRPPDGSSIGRDQLETGGFYAWVRHPLYLLSILFLLATPVMTAQWMLLSIFSIVYFIIGGLIEEKRLLSRFGEQYLAYRKKVPFILPVKGRRL